MDIETVLRECRAESLIKPLGFQTETGKTQCKHQLRKFTSNSSVLRRRQETILSFRNQLNPDTVSQLDSTFERIQKAESDIEVFFSHSDVESNSFEQLLFSSWPSLQIFNTIPFLLLCLSIFKQYIVPALAVLTPIFMVVMPYIILNYWYSIPLTIHQYSKILLGALGVQDLNLSNPRALLQVGITGFSLGQSIYQPIQNALHLQTIHAELMKKANAIQELIRCMQTLQRLVPSLQSLRNPLEDIPEGDPHRLFAYFWDSPYQLRLALQYIGDIEVVYRLASAKNLQPVRFLLNANPSLHIVDGIDPLLENPIPFCLSLRGDKHHAILTGPNRGGKSSVLRSTLLTVFLSQTFGMAFTKGSVMIRPFDWIATGLRLEDRPGSTSMFESEVEFAVQILKRATGTPHEVGFVFFDELFHSTNPPDGARTAEIFLQKLWIKSNVASFISTHVFDLAKKASPRCQRLCVPAFQQKDGSVKFTHTLTRGICKVSSVDLILKEKELLEEIQLSA